MLTGLVAHAAPAVTGVVTIEAAEAAEGSAAVATGCTVRCSIELGLGVLLLSLHGSQLHGSAVLVAVLSLRGTAVAVGCTAAAASAEHHVVSSNGHAEGRTEGLWVLQLQES